MRNEPQGGEATARFIAEKAKEMRSLAQQSRDLGFLAYLLANVIAEAEDEAAKNARG